MGIASTAVAIAPALLVSGGASAGGGLTCLGEPVTIGNGFNQTTLIGTEGAT